MKNNLIKGLSILAIVLLGVSITACGKTDSNSKTAESGEPYEYRSYFETIDLGLNENQGLSAKESKNGILFAIVNDVLMENDTYLGSEFRLHKFNESTKEDEISDWTIPIEEDSYISALKVNDDGTYSLVVNAYDPDTFESRFQILVLTDSGEEKNTIDLSKIGGTGDNSYLADTFFCKDGSIILQYDSMFVKISSDGSVVGKVETVEWINTAFLDSEDNLFYGGYNMETGKNQNSRVDFETGKCEPAFEGLPEGASVFGGKDGKLYASTSEAFYLYNEETKTSDYLFNWLNVDISSMYDLNLEIEEDGTIHFLNESWNEKGMKLEAVTIRKEKNTEENKVETVYYGCNYIDYDVKEKIIEFNKSNGKYRINVKSYSDLFEDYETQISQMNLDFTDGKLDLVAIDQDNRNAYIKADCLEDLNPYVDRDYNRSDLFDNVLKAWETDGKLYSISDSFGIYTIMGRKDVLKDMKHLSYSDLLSLRNQYIDKDFLSYPTKDTALYYALYIGLDQFVDLKNSECNFECEDFYNVLKFVSTFKDEIPSEDYDGWESIQNGNVIIEPMLIDSFQATEIYGQLFGDQVTFVGYPVSEGNGNLIYARKAFGISSKSNVKEGAWEFLKSLINGTEEDYYDGFPILKSRYNDMIEKEMTVETYIDENGVEQKQSKGGWGSANIMLEYYGATQENVDMVTDMISGATNSFSFDNKIMEIIIEEVEPFMAGQKSPEEVAKIIQSRVKIYLAETK